jgi:peptidoglycan/LPS O-acetylase OafA/YrhL
MKPALSIGWLEVIPRHLRLIMKRCVLLSATAAPSAEGDSVRELRAATSRLQTPRALYESAGGGAYGVPLEDLRGRVNRQTRYIPTLDGWRALSVIGVILCHGRPGFFSNYTLPAKLAVRGGIGVDIFFAISGFLICGLLLEEFARTGGIDLRRFYIRRCFRILPAYYAALAGICAASIFAAIPVNYSDLPSCLLFYRNYMPLGIDQQGGFYTAHFWSLAVEEHFYLFWPILLIIVKPKRAGGIAFLLALLVFGWRLLLPGILPGANFMTHTDSRIDGLLWGCLAAIYFPTIKRIFERTHFSQLWLPIVTILLVAEWIHVPGLNSMYTVVLPALVLSTVLQPASILGRILEWPLLRWIGTLSYSLYLWQMLFLPEMPSMKAPGAFRELQHWPWNVLAILACAVASRYLLEIPMTRLGYRLSTSSLISHPIGGDTNSKVAWRVSHRLKASPR